MDTINFTRGVPANESFPLDEVAATLSYSGEKQVARKALDYVNAHKGL